MHAWVRRLSAALVPEHLRGSRATLARVTAIGSAGRDDDEMEAEGDMATGSKDDAKAHAAHFAGAWVNGCFYRGDGSVAYYDAPCPDDPY